MYYLLKNSHLLMVFMSVTLYVYRFIVYYRSAQARSVPTWLKRIPHVVDTLLLSTGLGLIGVTGYIPFTAAAPWLSFKLVAVICYIFCGFYALNVKQTAVTRWFFFCASIGWLFTIICLAVLKNVQIITM
ncbi:SirB2 family protein [Photobacterium swingsii]|uniref:SirB2 family protein n=1 Tax=Photobacterium swingsii TaxID=680026 RepID=UPI0040691B7D